MNVSAADATAIKASTAEHAAAVIEKKEYSVYPIKKVKDSMQQFVTTEQLQNAYQDGFIINWGDFYQSLNQCSQKFYPP